MSQLLFVLAMIPLIMVLKWENTGYKLKKDQRLFNHMLFMEDLKLYVRSEEELKSLMHRFFQGTKGRSCAVLVLKQGVQVCCEGTVLLWSGDG